MKQRISVEQLWELAKNKGDWNSITDFNTKMEFNWKEKSKPQSFQECCKDSARWTTIGKMIEILDKNNYLVLCERENITLPVNKRVNLTTLGWRVNIDNDEIYEDFEAPELATALWQAVKFVLKDWRQ